jgi:hypothetical protein
MFLLPKNLKSQEITKQDLARIDSAKTLINRIGGKFSGNLSEYCSQVTTWGGAYASCYADPGKPGTIYLTEDEIKFGDVHNIAAALIHESLHLKFFYDDIHPIEEEKICYEYELEFLLKVPNIDPWLLDNALKMIIFYSK